MSGLLKFFTRTLVGGVLFLLPLALIAFLVGQMVMVVEPIAGDAAKLVSGLPLGPVWVIIITVALLIGLAFLAGLAAMTLLGRTLVDRIEGFVLNHVPGYSMIKNAAADAASSMAVIDDAQRKKAVFVTTDECWQLGFVTDEMDGEVMAVFIPDAPAPEAGTLLFVPRERIVETGLSTADALACLRRLGARMPPLPAGTFIKRPA